MSTQAELRTMEVAVANRTFGGQLLSRVQRHPRAADALAALICLTVQALVLIVAEAQPRWVGLLLAGLSSALLLWRRRFPVTVLVSVALLGGTAAVLLHAFPSVLALPAAVGVFTIASTRSIKRALLGYAIAVSLPALGTLTGVILQQSPTRAPTLLEPLALLALALGIATRSATQRREALAELMAERLATARVMERQRITAEMHDVVAHSLSTMIALADGAADGWHKHPERSSQALASLGAVGRSALDDMRRILQVLREDDPALDENLQRSGHNVPDLDELVEVFRHAGLPVRLTRSGGSLPDDPALTTSVYRIVQEALTNALRYAVGATRVDVEIAVDDALLTVQIVDDGHAAPGSGAPSQGSRRGLTGIAERAAAYGGTSATGPLDERGGWATSATLRIDQKRRG